VEFGDGDEADAKRFRLAIASNLDAKPFTPEERKDIAEYLYGEREWVMESIGKALGVSQATISNDLRGLSVTDKPSRPKGGRPKKTSTPKQRKSDLPELRSLVGARLAAGESVRRDEVAKQFNVATGTVDQAVTAERERIKIEQGKTETEQSHVHRWACAECGQPFRAK
jgi:transposase